LAEVTKNLSLGDKTTGSAARGNNNDYVLATGSAAATRLDLLDQIFGPASRELLTRVSLSSASRVADIGCDTGHMALWMAEQMPARGTVAAVDISSEQLAIASEQARAAGLHNISFHQAPAGETQLPRGSFDLVYSRFLMCHLTQPAIALREMWGLLKLGGALVCEDFEMSAVGTRPPTGPYARLIEISCAIDRQRGVDSDIGAKLHRLFLESGCPHPEIAVHQPAFWRGPEKIFWKLTLREVQSAVVDLGIASAEAIDSICREMERIAEYESVLVLLARVYQAWCRKT
jgi:SAM-dependent methyltransferase